MINVVYGLLSESQHTHSNESRAAQRTLRSCESARRSLFVTISFMLIQNSNVEDDVSCEKIAFDGEKRITYPHPCSTSSTTAQHTSKMINETQPLVNGLHTNAGVLEAKISLSRSPDLTVHLHLTDLAKTTMLFVACQSIEGNHSRPSMGSFVYALPDVRSLHDHLVSLTNTI